MYLVSWPGGSWEATLKYTITILAIYLAALWLTLVFWTYRDIRQRTRDPIVQTISVLLVLLFFLPGHWIYLILRPRYTLTELYERSLEEEALLQELEDQKACPTCRRRVQDDFLLCPSCRTQLKEPCRQCAKPLSYAWVACPYCGTEKPAREGGARPVRPRPAAAAAAEAQVRPARARASRPAPAPASPPAPAAKAEPARAKADASKPAKRDPLTVRPPVKEEPVID